jgi:hypothetical protein
LGADETNVYAIDPPAAGGDDEDLEKARREGNVWKIQSASRFQADLQRIYAAKLLAYSGDYPEALKLAAQDVPKRRAALATAPRVFSRKRNDFGTFEGTVERVETTDGVHAQIFRGISLQMKRAAIESPEDLAGETSIRHAIGDKGYANYATGTSRLMRVGSVSGSGAMLEFSISR